MLVPMACLTDLTSVQHGRYSPSRILLRHLDKEAFLLELLQKAQIDKLLGLAVFCLRHCGREFLYRDHSIVQVRLFFMCTRIGIDKNRAMTIDVDHRG